MKKGFTLAEVLITLTIIGVIAALTIPNLMQSYKKHQVEVSLKEAYSILSNAMTMAKADFGTLTEAIAISYVQENSQEYFGKNYLEPYLKISKTVNKPNTVQNSLFSDLVFKSIKGETTGWARTMPTNFYQLLLNNGMVLGIYPDNGSFLFVVDINNKKGPNKIGHDIFYFALDKDLPNNFHGGINTAPLGYSAVHVCDNADTVAYGGIYCALAIQENSWRIPDSYAVKKW